MLPIKKTKAAILTESKAPLTIDEIDLPAELEAGQVLVELQYTGICGAQINEIDAAKGPDKFLPHLLGHEGSGVVLAVGPSVATVKVGDHVVLHWKKGSGLHAPTPKYSWKGKTVNAGWVTTFNNHAIISENRLTTIPKDFPMDLAPLFGCAITTALGVINNEAKVRVGESIVVFGAGGVGLSMIQGAALVSAHPIIAVDLHDNKLQLAREFGATHIFNSSRDDVRTKILEIVGNKGADVVIENTGNPRVIELCYELTQAKGRMILVGVPKANDKATIYTLPLHFDKVLKGTEGGQTDPETDIPRYIKLAQSGKLDLSKVITDRYEGLGQMNQAIADLRAGKVSGRALVKLS